MSGRSISLFLVMITIGKILQVFSEIHIGTFCTKHEDCIRYCAYSKYGPEGASCCFQEKIRISKANWLLTGSNTCYCCPNPHQHAEEEEERSNKPTSSSTNVLSTPVGFGSTKINKTENENPCSGYLNTKYSVSDDVSREFCATGKCIQALVVMKMSFEYPSVCRAKKFPVSKN